jgi:hypothetical protein
MLSSNNNNHLFLTQEELKELTDRKIPNAQIRWLQKHAYPFVISASGKPKVLREYVMQKLRALSPESYSNQPNFDAIR